ncbi:antifungal protein ginkbilobin-2-like isoform X1 [Carica papaya]|uniref:antifungal protein ginkbilobin-2-like isoform X1 n=1 Tax=Carica papaya TaxID=3649 RepID=UPI000B8D19D3|nr:antifungal protein ginkbilobin-2-like isoform X1 [Carica papaya]
MGGVQRSVVTVTGLILLVVSSAKSVPNTSIISVLCNSGVYSNGDPFATSLAYVLDELQTQTPTQKDYDYFNISPYPNAFAYGHAACNKNLTSSDCGTCLGSAGAAMLSTCRARIGARAVLRDCAIRGCSGEDLLGIPCFTGYVYVLII